MAQDLDQILLAFFYQDKIFISRYSAEGKTEWVEESYRKLASIILDYYLEHGEIASINVVKDKVEKTDDVLFYQTIINNAKELKIEKSDFPFLMDKLKERYNKCIIKNLIRDVKLNIDAQKGVDEINDILHKVSNDITVLYRKRSYEEGTLQQTAKPTWEKYQEEAKNPELVRGVYTGISHLDKITNGLRPPDLMMVVGESGTGKSILCMNIAANMWLGANKIEGFGKDYAFKEGGCNVLYFSIEMDYHNMRQRLDSCLAEVDYYHLRDRELTEEEQQKFKRSCVFQSRYNKHFFITDIPRGITMNDIRAKYEEMRQVFEPDLIIIDHLGLMRPIRETGQDWLEQGDISADIHEFNRKYNKMTLAAVQANRPGKKITYGTHRVGRSEMIPQNASIIIQIGKREDEETYSDMPIYITKMRNGEQGRFTLYKRFSVCRICDEESLA